MTLTMDQVLEQLSERNTVLFLKQMGFGNTETIPYSAIDAKELIKTYWKSIPESRKDNLEEIVAAAYQQDVISRFARNDITTSDITSSNISNVKGWVR